MRNSLPSVLFFGIFNCHLIVVSGVHSSSSSISSSQNLSNKKIPPSSLLLKSITGGSTELRSGSDETPSLFGVDRNNIGSDDESIDVQKRNGSKERLEEKKVRSLLFCCRCLFLPELLIIFSFFVSSKTNHALRDVDLRTPSEFGSQFPTRRCSYLDD
jgi:hypothetical protein